MARITLTISDNEREALKKLAHSERRETRAQAEILIRDELQKRGLLKDVNSPSSSTPSLVPAAPK